MRRLLYCLIGTGLTAMLIVAGIGCASNPMGSEDAIPVDRESEQDVVGEHVGPNDPGGYPMTPATDIGKYESDDAATRKADTP